MAAVKVQIDLPMLDHYTIRGHLQSARAILEHASGGAAAAGLLICSGTCIFDADEMISFICRPTTLTLLQLQCYCRSTV
jgi:hypothetical protein